MSSTNFRTILIFASCVVGTCNILRIWVSFFWDCISYKVFVFGIHTIVPKGRVIPYAA